MILGRGTAQTDEAILAEYHQFLLHSCPRCNPSVQMRLLTAPATMQRQIGQPVTAWTGETILALFASYQKTTQYACSAFVAFLIFRGYLRPTCSLLGSLPGTLTKLHIEALAPYRRRLKQAQSELHYAPSGLGSELRLLIWLLAMVAKPLEELTRADFEAFREEYQAWYRRTRRAGGEPDSRLTRLETYLVHWGLIQPAQYVFRHEEHFARLQHAPIRDAIVAHLQWCDAKYAESTIHSRRAAMLNFFLWLQTRYPKLSRLDQVTRTVALEYVKYLKGKVEEGAYAHQYRDDLCRGIRLFFDFVIDERLPSSPHRNPFAMGDLPRLPHAIPRYLSDQEVRTILGYCHNGASLKERTMVITLLHTGIRAAELAALKTTDIVQVQGQWKLHVHEGKGLKDRVIPLTPQCLAVLRAWQANGWEDINPHLFTHHGKPWKGGTNVGTIIREMGHKLGVSGLTPHRFRHTFAVALLNYGMRESALQKLMGHATLNMTLKYGRILDQTVEQAFHTAIEQMQAGAHSWIPSFFDTKDYTLFIEADSVNWIRLPHGYCRRHPKLHCESDVKCLLCDRYCASPGDLPRLQEMYERFVQLGMALKAEVVAAQICHLQALPGDDRTEIPLQLKASQPDAAGVLSYPSIQVLQEHYQFGA